MDARLLLFASVLALGGCIQGKLDLPDFQLTDWTGDLPDPTLASLTLTSPETSLTATSVSSTTDGPSSSSSSSTSDDTSSESSTGEPQASACDPQPEDIETAVVIDSTVGWEHEPTDLLTTCVVTWVGTLGTALHLGLACQDGPHTVDVSDVGPSALQIGDLVELAVHIDVPWWANVHVVIRRGGQVMLAAMTSDALPGQTEGGVGQDFFSPLALGLLDDVCPIEPDADEPCDFICSDPCTVDRRQALAFIDGLDVEVIYDRGSGQLGATAVEVGEAIDHVEVLCPDVAGAWYSFVAIRGS